MWDIYIVAPIKERIYELSIVDRVVKEDNLNFKKVFKDYDLREGT